MSLKQRASVPRRVHFASSLLAGKGQTRQRRAASCSAVSRCENYADRPVGLIDPCLYFQGRAENTLLKAVEESGGRLGATIMRPGYFFPSKAYPKDAPNQRSFTLRVVDKLFVPVLSVFYPTGLISVEEMGRFALEAARGKWEGKGGPIFENAKMNNLVKGLGMPNHSRGDGEL